MDSFTIFAPFHRENFQIKLSLSFTVVRVSAFRQLDLGMQTSKIYMF